MEAKLEKDADSMVVKPIEYAASEYSASSEPPPVSAILFHCETSYKIYKVRCKINNTSMLFDDGLMFDYAESVLA